MTWNSEELSSLKELRLDPISNPRDKLTALVRHFKGLRPTVFAVTEGTAEPHVSKDLARKVRDLTQSGKLDWLVGVAAGRKGTALSLTVAEPRVGVWDHLTRPNSARFVTVAVSALSCLQQKCHASLSVEHPSGPVFPLHWAGEPYSINETQPEFLTIHPDVPGRLDVAFVVEHSSSDSCTEPVTGCWIAQPLALSDPRPGMRAHLPPGQYEVRLRVYAAGEILAFEDAFLLNSPNRPEDLAMRRLTPRRHH